MLHLDQAHTRTHADASLSSAGVLICAAAGAAHGQINSQKQQMLRIKQDQTDQALYLQQVEKAERMAIYQQQLEQVERNALRQAHAEAHIKNAQAHAQRCSEFYGHPHVGFGHLYPHAGK